MYFARAIQEKRVAGNVCSFGNENLSNFKIENYIQESQKYEIIIRQSVADIQIIYRMIDIIKEAEIVYC